MTDRVLVIGYGNELRRDDGAGRRVARLVAALRWPGVRALSVHQLTPELAEPLAGADLAVFVDAAQAESDVSARPITAAATATSTLGHASDPAHLLGLAEALFGRRPPAWLVAVPAADMSYGKGLSSTAKFGVRRALAEVRRLAGIADRAENAARAGAHEKEPVRRTPSCE